MWNWLLSCYEKGSLTIEDMEKALIDRDTAYEIWKEFSLSHDFVEYCQEEISSFYEYKKNKEKIHEQ